MNSEDYRGYVATPVRKTQVVTLYMRQLQMQNFFNSVMIPDDPADNPVTPTGGFKTAYIGLGRTDPWSDPNDSDISDTFPPIPSETMTALDQLVGIQKCTWKRYAKPYVAPTTAQKDADNTVYYKGLYYETTSDLDYALSNGFTAVMFLMVADSDECFPVDISTRQVGLFMDVNSNEQYLDANDFNNLSAADKGHLIAVQNMMPVSRQLTQLEKYYFLIQF
jgi:hypothetical protein